MTGYICPVCGYPSLREPPRREGSGGSYENCESCGFEFGYTDEAAGFTYRQWRDKWVAEGMHWQQPDPRWPQPEGWNPRKQLDDFLAYGDTSEDDVDRGVRRRTMFRTFTQANLRRLPSEGGTAASRPANLAFARLSGCRTGVQHCRGMASFGKVSDGCLTLFA